MSTLYLKMGTWYALAWIEEDMTPVCRILRIIRPVPEIRPGRSFNLVIERPASPGDSNSGVYRFRLIDRRAIQKQGPMVFGTLTLGWLERFAPEVVGTTPFPAKPWFWSDAQHFLDDVFGPLPDRQAPTLDEQRLVLRKLSGGPTIRVEIEGTGLIVEAENFPALCDKALALVRRRFPKLDPQGVVAEGLPEEPPEPKEMDVLAICALRIDGYRYYDALKPKAKKDFMARAERLEIPEDEVERHVTFFFLQRSLMHSPAMDWLQSPRWRFFRELFFLVVDHPPPPELIDESRYKNWQVNYEPRLAQCIEVVRRKHLATIYTEEPPPGYY
jgi:hypothetical protein